MCDVLRRTNAYFVDTQPCLADGEQKRRRELLRHNRAGSPAGPPKTGANRQRAKVDVQGLGEPGNSSLASKNCP